MSLVACGMHINLCTRAKNCICVCVHYNHELIHFLYKVDTWQSLGLMITVGNGLMFALLAFCTQWPGCQTGRRTGGAYKNPKVQKMNEINPDYQVYSWCSLRLYCGVHLWDCVVYIRPTQCGTPEAPPLPLSLLQPYFFLSPPPLSCDWINAWGCGLAGARGGGVLWGLPGKRSSNVYRAAGNFCYHAWTKKKTFNITI